MPIDRIFAIIGIIIGVPGVMILFATANETLAAFAGTLAALLLGAAFYIRYLFNAPPYSVPEALVTLEFKGDEKRATLTKKYKICPNFAHLSQLEHRNIASDGDISNFLWNGLPISPNAISKHLGEYVIRVDLPVNPGRWRIFEGELSYELTDSFNGNPEGMEYCIDFPTKKAVLTILFPKNKRCLSAEARKMQGAGAIPISRPVVSNDGSRAELVLRRPTLGAKYAIHWNW
jgi:hypothetical protein